MKDDDMIQATDFGNNNADLVQRLQAMAEPLSQTNMRKMLAGAPMKARLAFRAAMWFPYGTLTVQLPEGRVVKVGGNAPGPDAVLILKNWNLPKRALATGTIGVGESYMDGDWESPDMTAFLELFVVNLELSYRLTAATSILSLFDRVRHWLRRNTKTQAQRNIAAHYDLGNAFYSRWLDETMTYSSGIYANGVNSLTASQHEKYRRLAQATGITADDHVLEIGCGWGGFAEYAAREIGCRVTGLTISQEQFDFARERIARAGLQDKVELKFQDYRDETGLYDKVVSIEMFEAVGEDYWDVYFEKLNAVMKPGGKAGLQIITIVDEALPSYRRNPDFIQRYIFPGGMLPSPAALDKLSTAHNLTEKDMFRFPQDYARTLADWRERFWAAWPSIKPLGFDERFKRMWEFYFHYCEAGFKGEFIDVRQIVYAKP